MRIAIDIRSLIEEFPSGVSQYTYQIIKNLLKIDQANQYLLFYNSYGLKIDDRIAREFNQKNASLIRWRWPNKIMNLLLWLGWFSKLDKKLGGVDIFFMPNLNFADWSRDCRSVITVHDLSYLYPGFFTAKRRFWHNFVRPQKKLTRANKIIAVSESTKLDIVSNLPISPEKIQVIYSGVDFGNIQNKIARQPAQNITAKYGINAPFFLFIGNIESRKNVSGVIQAWQALNKQTNAKTELVMAGQIIEKSLKDQYSGVKFLNYIPEDDKYLLLKQAQALVYPSYYEGFGLPVTEAMAVGCPVITSQATALPEIAGQGALIVDPYNIQSILQAMKAVLLDIRLRQNLIERGLKVIKGYTWEKSAQSLLKLFKLL